MRTPEDQARRAREIRDALVTAIFDLAGRTVVDIDKMVDDVVCHQTDYDEDLAICETFQCDYADPDPKLDNCHNWPMVVQTIAGNALAEEVRRVIKVRLVCGSRQPK